MIWMILPLLIGLLYAELRCRQRLRRLTHNGPYRPISGVQLLPDFLTLVALVLILLSLRPSQLATLDSRPAPAIALVIDLSDSMEVADTYPDRLSLAKRELLALITRLPFARFALIPFAGEAAMQVPLTSDREALRFFINTLNVGLIASKGSAPEEAVLLAQRNLEKVKGEKFIILLTDGERTIADPPPKLSNTIPVYSLMLGTTTGGEVGGRSGSISQADPKRLAAIANQTGGRVLQGNIASPALFDLPLKETTFASKGSENLILIIALFLLLFRWVPTALSREGLFTLFLLLTLPLPGCDREPRQNRQGRTAFEEGVLAVQNKNTEVALTAFAGAADRLDGQQRGTALYNQGTLLLEEGQADAAIPLLEQALLLMPGDRMIRENLLLALSQSNLFTLDGSGRSKPTETDEGEEMSREQAEQLVNSVRLEPTAPPAQAPIHPPAVLKEW